MLARTCLLPVLVVSSFAQAQPVSIEEATEISTLVYRAYQKGKHAAVLSLERNCWDQPEARREPGAGVCARMMVAAGVMDLALQRTERRGGMPGFDVRSQINRMEVALKTAGHDRETSARIAVGAFKDQDQLTAGLLLAGMR